MIDTAIPPKAGEELDWIVQFLAECSDDPVRFAREAFDLSEGVAQAFELEDWQLWVLEQVRDGLMDLNTAIQISIASGHGIGKSALVAILIIWAVSTMVDTKGVVTANTETQLKTKTWVEVAVWFRRFIGRDLFKMTATAIFSADPAHEKTWRIDMVPWSERNTEAFAGLHNYGKRIIVVCDEASAIPDAVHQVIEGALTDKDTQIIRLMAGNPTRSKGFFRETHRGGKFEKRWKSRQIDSRTVSFTNKEQIDKWVEDYGEDSDFVRVRVRGIFPRVDAESFIPGPLVEEASRREPERQAASYVIGVDVARGGTNFSVLFPRCGRDAKSVPAERYNGLDFNQLADKIVAMVNRLRATIVCVDGTGMGGGLVDILRARDLNVIDVHFGEGAAENRPELSGIRFANRRSELYGAARAWLQHGAIQACAPGAEDDMAAQLSGPHVGFVNRVEGVSLQLEQKETTKTRESIELDDADAFVCTFACNELDLTISVNQFGQLDKKVPNQFPDYDHITETVH